MQILGIFYLEISGVSAEDNGMTMRKRKESQPQHFEALSVIFSSKTKNCHYAHKPLTLVLHFRHSLSKWDYTAVWWMQLRKQNQTPARHLNNVCHILFISALYLNGSPDNWIYPAYGEYFNLYQDGTQER